MNKPPSGSGFNIMYIPEGIADDLKNNVLDFSANNFRPLNIISHILNMRDSKYDRSYPSYIIYKFIYSFIYYCLLTNKLYIIKEKLQDSKTIIYKLYNTTVLPIQEIKSIIETNFNTIIKRELDIKKETDEDSIEDLYKKKFNVNNQAYIDFREPSGISHHISLKDAINTIFITKNNQMVLNTKYTTEIMYPRCFEIDNDGNYLKLTPSYDFITNLDSLLTTHFDEYLTILDDSYKVKLLNLIQKNQNLYISQKEMQERLEGKKYEGGNNMYYINCDNIKKIYITYSNKKVYLYKNENNIFITINKKILYINKKILGFDKKLNKYFIKI